jgi:hypothetical protein
LLWRKVQRLLQAGFAMIERRKGERRQSPATTVDVTRSEHETLYGQVAEILRILHRIEDDIHGQRERLGRLEADFDMLLARRDKPT